MKAVAPDTFLIEGIGQGERLLDFRRGTVKGSIEACYLRQFGIEVHRHLDGREVVRLVDGASGTSASSSAINSGVTCEPRVMEAAMHDPMAERRELPVAKPLSGPRQYRRKNLAGHARRFLTQIRRWEVFAIGPDGARRRTRSDAIDLPSEEFFRSPS